MKLWDEAQTEIRASLLLGRTGGISKVMLNTTDMPANPKQNGPCDCPIRESRDGLFCPRCGGLRPSPSKVRAPVGWPKIFFTLVVFAMTASQPYAAKLVERWHAKSYDELPGANAAPPASSSVAALTPNAAPQGDDSPFGPFDHTAPAVPLRQTHTGAPIIIMRPVVQAPVYQQVITPPTPHHIYVPGRRLPNGAYIPGYYRTIY
jgi:hypothetical protein